MHVRKVTTWALLASFAFAPSAVVAYGGGTCVHYHGPMTYPNPHGGGIHVHGGNCHPSGPATAFSGQAHVNCFGCGDSTGTASLFIGPSGSADISPNATATFTVNEPPSTCPATGSAAGTVTGAINVNFTLTRLGSLAVISTTGEITGAGIANIVVTSPLGNPCGGPADLQLAGTLTGT